MFQIIVYRRLETNLSDSQYELLRESFGCNAYYSPVSIESVGWIESVDMAVCQMLKSSLAKSQKDQSGKFPFILYTRSC